MSFDFNLKNAINFRDFISSQIKFAEDIKQFNLITLYNLNRNYRILEAESYSLKGVDLICVRNQMMHIEAEIDLQKRNIREVFEFCNSHLVELNIKLDQTKKDIEGILKSKQKEKEKEKEKENFQDGSSSFSNSRSIFRDLDVDSNNTFSNIF